MGFYPNLSQTCSLFRKARSQTFQARSLKYNTLDGDMAAFMLMRDNDTQPS